MHQQYLTSYKNHHNTNKQPIKMTKNPQTNTKNQKLLYRSRSSYIKPFQHLNNNIDNNKRSSITTNNGKLLSSQLSNTLHHTMQNTNRKTYINNNNDFQQTINNKQYYFNNNNDLLGGGGGGDGTKDNYQQHATMQKMMLPLQNIGNKCYIVDGTYTPAYDKSQMLTPRKNITSPYNNNNNNNQQNNKQHQQIKNTKIDIQFDLTPFNNIVQNLQKQNDKLKTTNIKIKEDMDKMIDYIMLLTEQLNALENNNQQLQGNIMRLEQMILDKQKQKNIGIDQQRKKEQEIMGRYLGKCQEYDCLLKKLQGYEEQKDKVVSDRKIFDKLAKGMIVRRQSDYGKQIHRDNVRKRSNSGGAWELLNGDNQDTIQDKSLQQLINTDNNNNSNNKGLFKSDNQYDNQDMWRCLLVQACTVQGFLDQYSPTKQ